MVTIIGFIIVGACIDVGLNRERRVIGFSNWAIPGAPFVNDIRGFARVFVMASLLVRRLIIRQSVHRLDSFGLNITKPERLLSTARYM